MSALDEIIARDAGAPTQSALDAIIARDSAQPSTASSKQVPFMNRYDMPGAEDDAENARLGSLLYGGVKGAADLVQAPAQLFMNAESKLLQSGVLGKPGPASQWVINKSNEYNDYLNNQENEYQRDTQGGNSLPAGIGRVATGAIPFMLGDAPAAMPTVAGVGSSLARAGTYAAKGGAYAALTNPVTDVTTQEDGSNNFFGEKGKQAALGAALSAGVPLLYDFAKATGTGAYSAVKPIINPKGYVGDQLANAMGDDAGTVAQNIRGAQTYVPGSSPTTAQVGQVPKLVATEKALANSNPDFKINLAQREAENNAARWQAIDSVAQTPEALAQAQATRKAVSSPLYDEAHANTANIGPAFMRYAQIPEMQEAMQKANSLASLDAAVGRGVQPVWPTPDSKTINGAALDYTSRALDDMISEAKGKSQKAALATLKDKVDSWTQTYIPGIGEASQTYAEHSVPVNTMEAGQQIAGTLGTRAMDANGVPQLQLSPYRSALVQALKSQKYGIDPDALTKLQGVGQDLQRSTVSSSLRSPGSDTAYNISANGWLGKQLYGESFEGAGNAAKAVGTLGALATGHPMVAGGILAGGNKAGQFVGGRLNKELGNFLLNPNEFLPYLESGGAMSTRQKALANAIERYFIPATGATASRVGLVNANN